MRKELLSAVAATAMLAAPAVAGEWTGLYTGAALGFAPTELSGNGQSFGNDDAAVTGFVGYDYDLGNFVVGGALEFTHLGANIIDSVGDNLDFENILRVKARGGYDIGNSLIYAAAGYAHVYGDGNIGGVAGSFDEGGYFVGAGYEYQVSEHFSLAGEVLYHDFNNLGDSNADFEATTIDLRAAYRF